MSAADDYRSEHPEPKITDFTCKQCKARIGEPCRLAHHAPQTKGHATRQDKLIRALGDWRVALADYVYEQEHGS